MTLPAAFPDMAEVLHSPQNYGVSAEEVPVFSRSMQGFLRLYFGSILEPQYSILQEAALERAPALMPQVFHDMLADNGPLPHPSPFLAPSFIIRAHCGCHTDMRCALHIDISLLPCCRRDPGELFHKRPQCGHLCGER